MLLSAARRSAPSSAAAPPSGHAEPSRAFGPKTSYSTIDRVSKTLRPLMDPSGGFPFAHVWQSLLPCGAAVVRWGGKRILCLSNWRRRIVA